MGASLLLGLLVACGDAEEQPAAAPPQAPATSEAAPAPSAAATSSSPSGDGVSPARVVSCIQAAGLDEDNGTDSPRFGAEREVQVGGIAEDGTSIGVFAYASPDEASEAESDISAATDSELRVAGSTVLVGVDNATTEEGRAKIRQLESCATSGSAT